MGDSSGAAELYLDFRLRLSTVTNQSIIASNCSHAFAPHAFFILRSPSSLFLMPSANCLRDCGRKCNDYTLRSEGRSLSLIDENPIGCRFSSTHHHRIPFWPHCAPHTLKFWLTWATGNLKSRIIRLVASDRM